MKTSPGRAHKRAYEEMAERFKRVENLSLVGRDVHRTHQVHVGMDTKLYERFEAWRADCSRRVGADVSITDAARMLIEKGLKTP